MTSISEVDGEQPTRWAVLSPDHVVVNHWGSKAWARDEVKSRNYRLRKWWEVVLRRGKERCFYYAELPFTDIAHSMAYGTPVGVGEVEDDFNV